MVDQIQPDRFGKISPLFFIPVLAHHRGGNRHIFGIRRGFHRLHQPSAGSRNTTAGDLVFSFRLVSISHTQHPFSFLLNTQIPSAQTRTFVRFSGVLYHERRFSYTAKSDKRVLTFKKHAQWGGKKDCQAALYRRQSFVSFVRSQYSHRLRWRRRRRG